MGKNTMIRKCIREYCERKGDDTWMALAEKMIGNVGVIFTTGEMGDVKEKIKEFVVPAPAKAGAVAQVDVVVPAGPTGMEPSQTNFFQTLNIATKINKGDRDLRRHRRQEGREGDLFRGHPPREDGLHPLLLRSRDSHGVRQGQHVRRQGARHRRRQAWRDVRRGSQEHRGASPSAPTTPPSPWFPTPSSTATRTSSIACASDYTFEQAEKFKALL